MKSIEKGKPLINKKPLELGDLKGDTVKITVEVPKELHKRIKQKALDEERGLLELVLEAIKEKFGI